MLDGNLYGVPYGSTGILVINPITKNAFINTSLGTFTGSAKWYGGSGAMDGNIYACPLSSNSVLKIGIGIPLPKDFILSRYINVS